MEDIGSLGAKKSIKKHEEIVNYDMYFLTCCLYDIWGKKIRLLNDKMNIEDVYETEIYKKKTKYKAIIHKIKLNNKIDSLTLQILSDNMKGPWNLNRIEININKRICYDNLDIDENNENEFMEFIKNKEKDNKEGKGKKVFLNIGEHEKLTIFLAYFKILYLEILEKKEKLDDYIKINLVEKFIEIYSNKELLIEYSYILIIFNFSFLTKAMFGFLDNFQKINIKGFDILDKDKFNFSMINFYEKNNDAFMELFKNLYEETKKEDNKKYKTLEEYILQLENFITICYLKYKEGTKIKEQNLINAKPVIKEIMNNKKDLNNYLSFAIDNYNMLYKLLNSDKKEKKLLVEPKLINELFKFNDFKPLYMLLIEEEEKYKFDSILNLSKIGIYYMKEFLKNQNEIIEYSYVIDIFTTVYGNPLRLISFLDHYSKLNYDFNPFINKKFNKILEQYKKDKSSFLTNYMKYFPKMKNKETKNEKQELKLIRNSLDNFMTIYQFFCEDANKIDKQRLENIRETLIEIIHNKNDIISCMKFISDYYDLFSIVFCKDKPIYLDRKLIEENRINKFKDFKKIYEEIIEKEKKYVFFVNCSEIFNYLYDNFNSEYQDLVIFKKLYEKELKVFTNEDFEVKIRCSIHEKGLDKIYKENYNNNFLIQFIINNDYYTKNEFKNSKNKDFSILAHFKVEEMDDGFFFAFEKYKIYSFFEEDFCQYIQHFCRTIKNFKYFDYFFKLLPKEKYNNDVIDLINSWCFNNINTFLNEKGQFLNFLDGMRILFEIMLKKQLTNKTIKLLEFLKNNIGEDYRSLIIFLLNTSDSIKDENVAKYMIRFILFPKLGKDDIINDINDNSFEEIIKFIKGIKNNKLIVKIFLSEIDNLSISKNDFFINSIKFELFKKLLLDENYSILSKDNLNNKKSDYWQNSEATCESLLKDLKDLNISYSEIKTAYSFCGAKEIREKIILILQCLKANNIEKMADDIINKVEEAKIKIEYNIKGVEQLKLFNIFINNKYPEINKELSQYNLKIIKNPLCNIYYDKEILKYEKDIKRAKEIMPMKMSIVFVSIFNNLKKEYDGAIALEKTIERMKNIRNIFSGNEKSIEEGFKNIDELKYLIKAGYKNENSLSEEIDRLLSYFGIVNYDKSLLINKIKIYIDNKCLYSVISGILILFDTYKYINNNILDKTDEKIYKELSKYKNLLKNIISLEKIKKINEALEKYLNYKNSLNDKKTIYDFFILLNQFPRSINFFIDIIDNKIEKIENLSDYIRETGDIILKNEDIGDLIKILYILEENLIDKKNPIHSFNKFLNQINIVIKNGCGCGTCLKNIIPKYKYIKSVLNSFENHLEGFFRKIIKIIEKSEFKISLNEKNNYEIKGHFYINNNLKKEEKKNLSSENMDNLFQRAVITELPKEFKTENKKKINLFIGFVQNINKIIDILNALYETGYQNNIIININIINSELNCNYECHSIIKKSSENNKKYSLEQLIDIFSYLKERMSQILSNFYKENQYIRLFKGTQIKLIYEKICKNIILHAQNREQKNIDLLQVISNDIIKGKIEKNYKFNTGNEKDKYFEILEEISKYIEYNLKHQNKTLENIYSLNKIIESRKKEINNEFKGIYYFMTNESQEIESLNIYMFLTGNLPINICFFYCSKYTNSQDLSCFLFRCFHCTYNCLFCIININLLNMPQKNKLISLIKELYKNVGKNMKSCLLIILNKEEMLHKRISKIKNIQILPPFKRTGALFDEKYKSKYVSYVIYSYFCGLGKSEKIKDDIILKELKNIEETNIKRKYVYFPIGGIFSRDDIIKRIIDLPDMSDLKTKYLIHFDISQTKEVILLNELIFKLLILRKFDEYEDAKYLGENVEILFEVPNDYLNYRKEIKILDYLEKYKISEVDGIKYSKELITVASIISMTEKNEILRNNFDINNKNFALSHKKSQEIILRYLEKLNIKHSNYYQINIFVKVLYDSFVKFQTNLSLSPKYIAYLDIRKFIINSLLNFTKNFLLGPYEEELVKNQEFYKKIMNGSKEENEKLINNKLNSIKSISFDQISPSLIVFTEDGGSINIIATCSEEDKEYSDLEKLYNLQNTKKEKLKLFKELQSNEIMDNVKNFLNCNFKHEEIQNIIGNYVYTQDNFIKVVLIMMRIRANIPIIIMGETGCGKTSLIEMASKLINNGKVTLKKMNIHAGINDKDIIRFFKEINSEIKEEDNDIYKQKVEDLKKNEIYLKSNKKEDIHNSFKNEIKQRKIWIFIDEINSCNSMGLFSEIFSKNTIYGRPLDDRYTYIAACNPYRISSKENIMFDVLYKKNHIGRNLVYSVNPMPITLLNFIFNFGTLKDEDEEKYIKSMVTGSINKIFNNEKKELDQIKSLIQIGTKCVKLCHNYLKCNNDVSIVSLREINRYNIFVEFFVKYYIIKQKENEELNDQKKCEEIFISYNSKTKIDIILYAINLSLFICYYLRLPNKESRKTLENKLNESNYFIDGFLKIPLMEIEYIVNNLEIPKGIAKNKSLKENLFILFFCLINKIPIIICGKPGRSKTLSFKILQRSMKGMDSKSFICQQYPKMEVFRIQGSLYTKSSEIIKVFKRGRDYQKEQENQKNKNGNKHLRQKGNENTLVVICIDEIGLADMSENNPLKVLHFELEKKDNKISFVGISNWFIDAAKMNRVIYNVVQDPDKEDIIETCKEIVKSYEENDDNYTEKYGHIFLKLSEAYYKFINKKKDENDKYKDFHGSRDFFNLIKSVIKDIIKNKDRIEKEENNEILNEICINNIERNFGGLQDSVSQFKSYFFEGSECYLNKDNECNKYNILKCIEDNINDESSRYLLLIIDNYFGLNLVNNILDKIYDEKSKQNEERIGLELIGEKSLQKLGCGDSKKIKYYTGSRYKSDQNNISYSTEILKDIKEQMDSDKVIILKDLNLIYPSLYELFNQSFEYFSGKKTVHLGSSDSLALVNDKFKVIVLLDKNRIENQDPPFLNRFEKHIISFSTLLSEELILLSEEIYSTLKQIINIPNDNNLENLLKNYFNFIELEEIKGLVYIGAKTINDNKGINQLEIIKKIKTFVFDNIVPCFSEILMIIISKFGFKNKFNSYYNIISETYKIFYCYNIYNYLKKLDSQISLVYTFTSIIYDVINDEESNKYNLEFNKSSTIEINMNSIYSTEQIKKEFINYFYLDDPNKISKNLLLLKFNEEDINKLNDIYYLLKGIIMNINNSSKKIVFIIYLQNNLNPNNYILFLSDCPRIMISNLFNNYSNFIDILANSNENLLINKIFDINSVIDNNIENILNFFSFNSSKIENKVYSDILKTNIIKQKYFKELIIKYFIDINKKEDDYAIEIFKKNINNEKIKKKFLKILNKNINELLIINVIKSIYFLEKEQIIGTFSNYEEKEIITPFIENYLSNTHSKENNKFNFENMNLSQKIVIMNFLHQKLPFSESIFSSLFEYIKNKISDRYLKEESFFTKRINEEELEEKQKKYLKQIKNLDSLIEAELFSSSKYKIILEIFNSGKINLISNLFEDCFNIFIKNNKKLTSKYDKLSELLKLLIQLKLKTKINGDLSDDEFNKDTIQLDSSFLNIIIKNRKNNDLNNDFKKEEKERVFNEGHITPQNNEDINENKDKNIYFMSFIEIVNFIQSYSKEIYMILELYYFLLNSIEMNKSLYKDNNEKVSLSFYEDIINLIINKKIEMKDSDINRKYSRIYKLPFFYIIESLSKIFKDKLSYILQNTDTGNYTILKDIFFNSIQYHIKNLLNLEKKFLLFSNEIFYIDVLYKMLYKIKLKEKDYISFSNKIEAFKFFLTNNTFNNDNKGKGQEIINFLDKIKLDNMMIHKIFGENKDEYKYLENKILINYLNIYNNNEERQNIIDSILFDFRYQLIEYSYPLMEYIFIKDNSKSLEPGNNKKFLKYFEIKKDLPLFIDKKNDPEINKILLYRFEIICDKFFINILNEKNTINNLSEKLCGNESKKYLEKAIEQFYEQKKDKPLKNTCNIYCIAFIRRYLNYYVDILLDEIRYQEFTERKEINDLFFSKNSKVIKRIEIIKYYIFKLILNKINGNWEKFLTYFDDENDRFGFNDYDCFKGYNGFKMEYEKDESLSEKLKPILLLDKINKNDNLKYNEVLFLNNLDRNNEIIFFNLFIKDNINECLYNLLSNISILFLSVNESDQFNNIKEKYKQLLSSILGYLNKLKKIGKESLYFINLIFDKKNYDEKIAPKIGINYETNYENIKIKKIILLYSLRFIFPIIINSNSNNCGGFFYKLLTNNLSSEIEKYYMARVLKYDNIKNILDNQEEKMLEKNNITYRILIFIFYTFLFYSNILDILKDNHLKKYFGDKMTCFKIIENNWELIQIDLDKLDIRIFFNVIFEDISTKLISCPDLKTEKETEHFIKDINEIIVNKIKNKDLIDNFIKLNDNIIKFNPKIPKNIIQEIYSPKIYPEDYYPDLQYFYMSELPSKNDFISKFNSEETNKEKYPIINAIIKEDKEKKLGLLKYIPKINKLCNFIMNTTSYKYTREEAKTLFIKNIIHEDKIITLLNEFVDIYKEIRPFIKIDEDPNGDNFTSIENNLYLSNLCVDSYEKNYGYVLLTIYKEMVKWQNIFIDTVINSKNIQLNIYKDYFDKDIKIQECENEEILYLPSFEDKENDNIYIENFNLMKIIIDNSLRRDNKIVYIFEEIENELASFILPKIKKLKENEFNKVNYKGECLIEDNDNIIFKYIEKYPQREIKDDEAKIIYDYMNQNIKFDSAEFLFNIPFLTNYLLFNDFNVNEKLENISKSNEISNIEILKNFFEAIERITTVENSKDYFTVKTLISIFDFVEIISWDTLKIGLNIKFIKDIDDNIEKQFSKVFDSNNGTNLNISKLDFCTALRKFITRYLLNNNNLEPKNNLKTYLNNYELWPIHLSKDKKKNEEDINKIFENINVEISQALKLYEFLGGDKSKLSKYTFIIKEKQINSETTKEDNLNEGLTEETKRDPEEENINDELEGLMDIGGEGDISVEEEERESNDDSYYNE